MKKMLLLLLCLLLALPTGAFAEEEKVLNLFTWELYVDDQTIADFEAATGIRVVYASFDSNESMLAKLQLSGGGDYDVIIASDYAINIARKAGLLQKIDKSIVDRFDTLDPLLLSPYFDPDNEYSVPYMSGTPLIIYNPDYVDFEITGYESLWDERLKDSVVVMDDARNIIGITLKTLGQSFNVTDDAILQQAAEKLAKLRPNIRSFNSDTPDADILSGECSVAYTYGQYAAYALMENPELQVVYPQEGVGFGIDALVIPEGAKHPENANLFINFLLQPEIAAQVAQAQQFRTPVPGAYEFLPESYLSDPTIIVPEELLKDAEFIIDVGEHETKFQNIWTDFKLQ
ncbi:MAG: spermidine/putrescine ABC transporter substrate-binding protein [Clostridiales bacterium]|nr:spermidine/putrescine ABC transporter substrate-binding protein [Clostridiales bacterium]